MKFAPEKNVEMGRFLDKHFTHCWLHIYCWGAYKAQLKFDGILPIIEQDSSIGI
jgi:hypothetical protein